MGFVLGFLIGVNSAIGLAVFGVWWSFLRTNKEAAAKFLQGCALVLAYKKAAPTVVDAKEEGKKKPVAVDVFGSSEGSCKPSASPDFSKRRS